MGSYSEIIMITSLSMGIVMVLIVLGIEHVFANNLLKDSVDCQTVFTRDSDKVVLGDKTMSDIVKINIDADMWTYIAGLVFIVLALIGMIIFLVKPDWLSPDHTLYAFLQICIPLCFFIGSGFLMTYIILRDNMQRITNDNQLEDGVKVGIGVAFIALCIFIIGLALGVIPGSMVNVSKRIEKGVGLWICIGLSVWCFFIGVTFLGTIGLKCPDCFDTKCSNLTEGETVLVLEPKPEKNNECSDGYPYIWNETSIDVVDNVATITDPGHWSCGPYQTPPGCPGQTWSGDNWVCPVTVPPI